jgi:hypothetical protein
VEGELGSVDELEKDSLHSPTRRANPVDVLFASFPGFLYYNATYGRYLLEPLLRYQDSSLYSKGYAAPDLGMACFIMIVVQTDVYDAPPGNTYPSIGGNDDPAPFTSLDGTIQNKRAITPQRF